MSQQAVPTVSQSASPIDFVLAPGRFFRDLNGRWFVGLLVSVILTMATVVVLTPLTKQVAYATLEARHIAVTEQVAHSLRIGMYVSLVVTPIGVVIAAVIAAALLWGLSLVFTTEMSFKKVFAVVCCASIASSLDHLVGASMNYLADWHDIDSALRIRADFLSLDTLINLTQHPSLLAVSRIFGLGEIWYWVLLAVGLMSISRLKKNQAAFGVISLALLASILAALTGLLQKVSVS